MRIARHLIYHRAAVVIGGWSSSLILTPFVVPIVYLWIAPSELSEPIKIGRSKTQPAPQPAG